MANIYVITNNINGQQYVGQTVEKISRRFGQHKNSALHLNNKDCNSPLHLAMRKYGIDVFSVELLEECPQNKLDEREIYWINKLDTYYNGYNATLGGQQGTRQYNYEAIAEYYKKTLSKTDTQSYFNCDYSTVKRALHEFNIEELQKGELTKQRYGNKIARYDLDTQEILQIYNSQVEAAKDMYYKGYAKFDINNIQSLKGTASRLGSVAKGKRKQSYGFGWKIIKDQGDGAVIHKNQGE